MTSATHTAASTLTTLTPRSRDLVLAPAAKAGLVPNHTAKPTITAANSAERCPCHRIRGVGQTL